MAELKKCPFCGSKARIVENHDWGTVHIRCDDEFGTCSVLPCTEDLYHPHEAEKEWNARATTTEAEIIEKFAEKLGEAFSEKAGEIKVDGMTFDILTLDSVIEIMWDLVNELKEE